MNRAARALGALLAGLLACQPAQVSPPATAPAPSAALAQIVAEVTGARPQAAVLPDVSLRVAQRQADSARALMARLDRLPTAGLSHEEELTLELLRWDARRRIDEPDVYWYSFPVVTAISPMRTVQITLAGLPLGTDTERKAYLTLLEQSGGVLDGIREKTAGQAERRIVVPREQIDLNLPYIRSFAEPAATHPFALTGRRLEQVPEGERAAFRARADRVIDSVIAPRALALARSVEELRAIAPAEVGLWQYPGGTEAYRILVRRETTLEVTPEQVHEIGLRAVAAINARMQQVRDSLGFKGTKAEFHEQLRRDRRFYVRTPDEVGQGLMQYIARIEPRMGESFAVRPKQPYGVRRLDPALEPSMTYGYYNWGTGKDSLGYYNFNGSDLDQRSMLMAGAIAYHELVPGHHFQINLARENEALPPFRRSAYYAGYNEGWGEYSSSVVAAEMGMYRDAYEVYGRLVFDMFFAVRLVVDTGMNHYHWSRQRAMDYMRENTLESDVQINSETMRYSTRSPAQALAYRMGRETMVSLRAKAEKALGPRFDLRKFHSAVLMSGALPLFLLERHIDWYIAHEQGN